MVGGLYPSGEESQAERAGANPGTMATAQIAAAMGDQKGVLLVRPILGPFVAIRQADPFSEQPTGTFPF